MELYFLMLIDPNELRNDLNRVEGIEKTTLRLVTQALYDYRLSAAEIFQREPDLVQDIAEDITREALDRMGMSRIDERLYGKIDYKKARYVFNREYAIRQALYVDSKAEKEEESTITIQTAQTSMAIRHFRSGSIIEEQGGMSSIIDAETGKLLTTTVFVKYNYQVTRGGNNLIAIILACIPNALLQDRYNPGAQDTIWRSGRNAPTRGERFRVRLVFDLLKRKANWRVQRIPMAPQPFIWDD